MDFEELKVAYRLSSLAFQEIQRIIIDVYTAGAKPSNFPTAIILGGQPGAGKSELITAAQQLAKMSGETIVVCNADDYRDFHPMSDEIKKDHEKYYPSLTATYSQPWNNGLRAHCEKNHYNYILETTFSSGKLMNDTIREIKKKGYKVVIMLLAVNRKFSILGTYMRYESMKEISGLGRRVDKQIHDEKYNQIPITLAQVMDAKLYDDILIFRRREPGEPIKNLAVCIVRHNPDDVLEVYLAERDKPWPDSIREYFDECCDQVVAMMRKRKATKAIDIFYGDIA